MTRDALLLELEATRATLRDREIELDAERTQLAAERVRVAELSDRVARLLLENDLLRHRVEAFAQRMFGKSSEKLDPRQLRLAFEQAEAAAKAEEEALEADALETALGEPTPATPRARRTTPSKKPAHASLPVKEVRLDPPEAERVCTCCGEPLSRIREEVSERTEYVPASFFVERTVRGVWACPCGEGGVLTERAPASVLPKGSVGTGLAAHVVVSKYADHLPVYRQEQILARAGVDLPRSTLGDVVATVAERLAPVADAILAEVLAGRVVHTDDTPVTYLTPPKGSARGFVWTYVGEKGDVAYDFTPTRSRDGPLRVLGRYRGFLQADAYAGYDALYPAGEIVEVGCWAHARRYFVRAKDSDPRAALVLLPIQRLYAVEAQGRTLPEAERQLLRLSKSKPLLDEVRRRLDEFEAQIVLPKSPFGKAVAYVRGNWTALTRHLEHGFLAIDNNAAERAMRPVAVGRKNWMFAGNEESGRKAAVLMSVVATCKARGIDPEAYLRDVLARIAADDDVDPATLTPRAWQKHRAAAT